MRQTTAFLNTIPVFLRRPRERAPSKPIAPLPAGLGARVGAGAGARPGPRVCPPCAETTIHGGRAPVRPDFLAAAGCEGATMETEVQPAPLPRPQAQAQIQPLAEPRSAATSEPAHRAALPWLARKTTPPAPEHGSVVELVARRETTENAPRRIQDQLRAGLAAEAEDTGGEDVAFQVTLPLAVIRQIRLLAAQESTTHRAVVLRALRAAGLDVPDGADVDRRVAAAKRRQQA